MGFMLLVQMAPEVRFGILVASQRRDPRTKVVLQSSPFPAGGLLAILNRV